jgi:hypothetical protein
MSVKVSLLENLGTDSLSEGNSLKTFTTRRHTSWLLQPLIKLFGKALVKLRHV